MLSRKHVNAASSTTSLSTSPNITGGYMHESGSSSATTSPDGAEEPTVRMRILVSQARGLASRDRNGLSDPFVKLSIGGHTFTTPVVYKSLNPVWDSAFDFELEAQSMPSKVQIDFWDKDRFSKDFLGAVSIDMKNIWNGAEPCHFDDPLNQASWYPLGKNEDKKFKKVSGEVEIKVGFLDSRLAPVHQETSRKDCKQIWSRLTTRSEKLGLGQRLVQNGDEVMIPITDIPMTTTEGHDSLGMSAMRIDPESPQLDSLKSNAGSMHGIVFMEIVSASSLPRAHNVTRTGFDMDPFVVVSFGKYIFRTRVIRHNLNPVWKGKFIFRVHHGEENFQVKYAVHDWDKLSGNDYVGKATMGINELIKLSHSQDQDRAPSPVPFEKDEKTLVDPEMNDYTLKLDIASNLKSLATSQDSTLSVRAKFVPYTSLRRRFWLGLAKAFDGKSSDPDSNHRTGYYGKVLIQAMLEGLGSTLSNDTVDKFFEPYNKDPERDELTFDELFDQLERQVRLDDTAEPQAPKPRRRLFWRRKKHHSTKNGGGVKSPMSSLSPNPNSSGTNSHSEAEDVLELEEEEEDEHDELFQHLTRNKIPDEGRALRPSEMVDPTEADFDSHGSENEHIIRISICPICRDPGLGKMLETDVITHIAVCSGTDGFNLDKLVLGDFVTEENAQRKWITKVVNTLGYGRYVIGKSNANIIVQDRATGLMLEEKMPTFIRLGIRLLYKSPAHKISVARILANMSRRQGQKFDDPRSKRNIEPFIRFHNLEAQMDDVLEPIESFNNFNEFFYRKLKPNARILASPRDNKVAVSVADCRMTCFQTIDDATHFWIKGRQFTLGRMLDDENLAKKYVGGSLAIFRLAPQDYHRYHIPVKGVMSQPRNIDGQYYTVNPMSIRSKLDVYGENKRVVSTIESQEFGTVAYVAIGAMMVGSIVLTSKPGEIVERMDEHGYFAFGGSTIVVLFEPNSIQFDKDLLVSSKQQIEMLVKVGNRIGVSTRN